MTNGLKIQWYHALTSNTETKTWIFPVPFNNAFSYTIVATPWANSNNVSPMQFFLHQKNAANIKFMSLSGGNHEFIAIGF